MGRKLGERQHWCRNEDGSFYRLLRFSGAEAKTIEVTIPRALLDPMGWEAGDGVDVASEEGRIVISRRASAS